MEKGINIPQLFFFYRSLYLVLFLKIYRLYKNIIAVTEKKNKKTVQCTCTGDIHTKPDNVNIYNQLIKIAVTSERLMSQFRHEVISFNILVLMNDNLCIWFCYTSDLTLLKNKYLRIL